MTIRYRSNILFCLRLLHACFLNFDDSQDSMLDSEHSLTFRLSHKLFPFDAGSIRLSSIVLLLDNFRINIEILYSWVIGDHFLDGLSLTYLSKMAK